MILKLHQPQLLLKKTRLYSLNREEIEKAFKEQFEIKYLKHYLGKVNSGIKIVFIYSRYTILFNVQSYQQQFLSLHTLNKSTVLA